MNSRPLRLALAVLLAACAAQTATAQAPNVIQFFMPGGALPPREIRFELARDDGRIETLFTDSKGKYSMDRGLVRAGDYTVTAVGDGSTYATTVTTFRISRANDVVYVPVFLRAIKNPPAPRARVVDLSADDAGVPAEARAAYDAGVAAWGKGQADEAVAHMKRAVEAHPNYLRALNDLGVIYMKTGRLTEAGDALGRALKVNARFELARLNLGTVLNRQGKHAEAAALLETLFRENPALDGARVAYADALYDAGRLADARKVLRDGLEDKTLERPKRSELHYKLGRVLSREEKYADAVRELQRAVELDPQAANAHMLLGGGLVQLRREAEAERALLRAYELGGRDAGPAQLMLGELYTRQRKYDAGLRAFEQYLRDVPDARNAAQIRGVVTKLREALGVK